MLARALQLRITEIIRNGRPTYAQAQKLREIHSRLNDQTFATPSQERAVEGLGKNL